MLRELAWPASVYSGDKRKRRFSRMTRGSKPAGLNWT